MSESTLEIGCVILAGGLARRMEGRDKGLVKLAGKPMVQWVLDAVKPQVGSVLINANRNKADYEQFGPAVAEDLIEGHLGPLAGLLTGLKTLQMPAVFMCPCDSPFLPVDMVSRLCASLTNTQADIAVAHDGSRMQPVFCLARQSTVPSLTRFLDSGERKIDRWFAAENTSVVDFSDTPEAFRNINSEQDRLEVEQLLAK